MNTQNFRSAALVLSATVALGLVTGCAPDDDSNDSGADAGKGCGGGLAGLLSGCKKNGNGDGDGDGDGNGSVNGNENDDDTGGGTNGPGTADCEAACDHVVACLDDSSLSDECLQSCRDQGASEADLGQLVAMDCSEIRDAYGAGEGGHDDMTGDDDFTQDGGGSDLCASACQQLADCGLCLMTDQGCLDTATCTQACQGDPGGAAGAECVLGAGCDSAAVEACLGGGGGGGGDGGGGGEGGGSSTSSDCDGCIKDGDSCTWYASAGSGASFECDSSCCN